MAKAWTAPEGDVVPDPIETKIKIMQAQVVRINEVKEVLRTVMNETDHPFIEVGGHLEEARKRIVWHYLYLRRNQEEQRGTP